MATFSVTMMPKSRSSGSDDATSTANPPMVVAADVKNARPVRADDVSCASSGVSPRWRSSTYRDSRSTENSATAAITSGPLTVVSGLSSRPARPTTSAPTPIASNTGTSASTARAMLRSRSTSHSAAMASAR